MRYVCSGRKVVADVDLERFFDRVDHNILMDCLRKWFAVRAVVRLIRIYLDAGTLVNGGVDKSRCEEPHSNPLSPFVASVPLDEVDREFERRGCCIVRDAEDVNMYVRSQKAG
ncbi:hypothetical protein [Pseudomonas sp. V98_8]|uniref:hypothetical protein n=1 Tax=Pseudomonas sp. V98_8 TaxID=3044228 RepID=UPI0032B79342